MKPKPEPKPGIPLPQLHAAGLELAKSYQEFLKDREARKQAEQDARSRGVRLLK
jgi:hypothetical protein